MNRIILTGLLFTSLLLSSFSNAEELLRRKNSAPPICDSGVKKFSSIDAMIGAFNDYDKSNNTFDVVTKKPLHIRLSPLMLDNDLADVKENMVKMSIIYGIYRTFINTNVDKVSVTSYPISMSDGSKLRYPEYTITKTRSQALSDIKRFIPVSKYSDLVSGSYCSFISDFNQVRYDDQGGQGITKFFDYIKNSN